VPVVMVCVNRGVGAPWTILNDQQDSIAQRDTGWIQLYCRNSQEVLDTIIQAFKIAEQTLIPIMVCYDGFVLSHASTPVDVPDPSEVDRFLRHISLIPASPKGIHEPEPSDPQRASSGPEG